MRWNALFDDLEAQAADLERAERAAEVDERTRAEVGALHVLDRLRAAAGNSLQLHMRGPLQLSGELRRTGPDWALLDEGAGREALVAFGAVLRVSGLGRVSAVPGSAGIVESRLGLRHALRGIARDRSAVRLHLLDGSVLPATVDRVGADFIEVAVHAPGEPRRRSEVREVALVTLSALVAVRRS